MNSSGIKRGLASAAVAALAVTGLPFLASSASAVPASDDVSANNVEIYSLGGNAISAKNDGTNTTVSLVAGGGANVTSVQWQYRVAAGDWTNIGSPVARDTNGVFATEWTPALGAGVTSVDLRAVPNTGIAQADSDTQDVTSDATTTTVELGSEGPLGVFQSPYTADGGDQFVGITGTTSGATNVNIAAENGATYDVDGDDNAAGGGDDEGVATATAPAPTAPATTSTFGAILNLGTVGGDGYTYSGGSEPNQLVVSAATDSALANETGDAEASSLYVQTITTVTATADRTNIPAGQTSAITVTVKDQQGAPVANALVDYNTPDGADADTLPEDSGTAPVRTNAKGQATFNLGAGNYTFYANTTSEVATQSAGDKAATPVAVTEYSQTNTTLVATAAQPDLDPDEIAGSTFKATLKDQNGNPVAGQSIEYRWTFDDTGAAAPVVGTWAGPLTTDGNGQVNIPFTDQGAGKYTLDVRRPNVAGSGLLNGTPVTVDVAESEITWEEGTGATTPANSSGTYKGVLALPDGTPLAGRTVQVTLDAPGLGEDSAFSTTQPAGSTLAGGVVTATTNAQGEFSVSLTDPTIPPNVTPTPESRTLTADATALSGAGDPVNADATDVLAVNFVQVPPVGRIDVTASALRSSFAPGRPADIDVTVYGKDADTNPANDPVLTDYPVTITVDKGFLSPNAETEADLVLAAGHDATGDDYGYFKNDGTSKAASTGDDPDGGGVLVAQAGAAVAIEKDAGFDDDGLVDVTVSVKAGDVTETEKITFDSRNYVNLGSLELARVGSGDATVGDEVGLNLWAKDQFGNLVGGQLASITDDSADADVNTDGDFGQTQTDFTTSGIGIEATAEAPTVQTLLAQISGATSTTVNAADDAVVGSESVSDSSDPITWVAAPVVKKDAQLTVSGKGAKTDRVKANAISDAAGATATLWVNGKKVKSATLNASGDFTFRVKDKNGNKATKYTVKIGATTLTFSDSASKRIR